VSGVSVGRCCGRSVQLTGSSAVCVCGQRVSGVSGRRRVLGAWMRRRVNTFSRAVFFCWVAAAERRHERRAVATRFRRCASLQR
jgi:hypothetical protein